MRWIGQHIWDLISRFRNYVYLEKVDTSISTTALVVDPDGKVGTNSDLAYPYNGGAMFAVSGMENSFNEERWLIPRRYKDGDYLSGASEDLSAVEMANIDFVTHLRLETFVSDGVLQPVRYEVYIVMQQTALDANVEFGIFETNPTDGDSDITYTFTSYGSTQPYGTADRIKKISGTISDTLTAGTICSFGFHNPSGTPATQDIDDLRYWITVYFN